VVPGDGAARTGQIVANGKALLDAGGLRWSDVVRAEVHLGDVAHRLGARDVLLATLPPEPPTRATVIVGLAKPDHGLEITFTAVASAARTVVGTPGPEGVLEPPSPHLSSGLRVGGRLYVSGLLGDPDAENHDLRAQSAQTVGRLERTLRGAGLDWADVVSGTVYVVDRRDVPVVEETLGRALGTHRFAYSTVQVRLLRPAAKVEIMLLAVR
jgi:enamine deaminase RidA (YjgF/YER057c/UK114 family)